MAQNQRPVMKIYRVVSLGDELSAREINDILKKAISLNPDKPEIFFTVTDCTEEQEASVSLFS